MGLNFFKKKEAKKRVVDLDGSLLDAKRCISAVRYRYINGLYAIDHLKKMKT